jgi:hypothetical protein
MGINMLPVDYISRAIVALSLRKDVMGGCFNLVNDEVMSFTKLSDSIVSWGEGAGIPIQKVSFDDWLSQCNANEELKVMQLFFPQSSTRTGIRMNFDISIDLDRANHLLQREGIHRSAITKELLNTYIAYLAPKSSGQPKWHQAVV